MTAAAVLAVARRELGTAEAPAGSNRQKYGVAYGWNGVAWCAQFAWYVLTNAGDAALIPKTASTVVMRDWYMKRGQWTTRDPHPGDLVFFKFPGNPNPVNHVAIVEAVEAGGTLITIEGNTSGTATGDQRNGGMVARKRRLGNIVGFARPAYTPVSGPPKPVSKPTPSPVTDLEDEMSQQQVDQLRSDIGYARDQILTRLGVNNPPLAPAKLPPEQLAGIDPARRVDVGYARDQLVAELASQRALLEAIAEKVGLTPNPPGGQS